MIKLFLILLFLIFALSIVEYAMVEKVPGRPFLTALYFTRVGKFINYFLRQKFASKAFALYTDSFLSKYKIKKFIKKHNVDMSQFVVPTGGFKSFNDFFIRKLKPNTRVIDQDENVVVSPADSNLIAVQKLTEQTRFFVKSKKFCLKTFLQNEQQAKDFERGTLLLFRLMPENYHRYHFPFDGAAKKAVKISGVLQTVHPIAYKSGLLPLQENEREKILLTSQKFGEVLAVPVGATFVGRITNSYTPDKNYKKGDEIGYFSFGGSSLVLLFKKDIIKVEEKFIKNSEKNLETFVSVGERVATWKYSHH